MNKPAENHPQTLSLFDTISIGVGIIIGVGIFATSPLIAMQVNSPEALIGVWTVGALISLVGAFCYAELATVCTESGGEYRFLQAGYGPSAGFVFAWCSFWIIQPCNIGMMGFVFGRYGAGLLPLEAMNVADDDTLHLILAVVAIAVLTATNLIGLRSGAIVQNILTGAKYLGLILIVVAALVYSPPAKSSDSQPDSTTTSEIADSGEATESAKASDPPPANYSLALVLVLFSFGGWNNISFVVAEMKNARRNAPLALILTVLFVTAIYLAITCSFLWVLGLEGLQQSEQVAVDAVTPALVARYPSIANYAGGLVAGLICLSALGAINGMILTTPRVYASAGKDHYLFHLLSRFNEQRGVPTRAMAMQSLVAVLLTVIFGSYARGDTTGFARLFDFSAPVFWFFVFMVAVTLFLYRGRNSTSSAKGKGELDRFSVRPYPWLPLVFVVTTCLLFWSSLDYSLRQGGIEGWIALGVVVAGGFAALLDSTFSQAKGR